MKQLLREGIRRLFIANRGPGNRDLGIILRDAKAGSDEAFQILQQKLADIGVTLKNKKDLAVEEVKELTAGIVGFKKGGVVRGLDDGAHKNVRLI